MRLSPEQQQAIRDVVANVAGPQARVRLFGSRLDDTVKGGDVDLLVELDDPADEPAMLMARLANRISRRLDDIHVDVVLLAPDLRRLSIHEVALREGQLL